MVVRDEDFGAALTLAEESDGTWSPSEDVSSREPRDWRPRFEQERARAGRERERADAAEARLSETAVDSAKRPKVVSPSGQVSRLQKENARLSREAARLDKRLALESQASESHKETIRSQNREIIRLVAELRRLRDQKDTVKRLSEEAYRLRFALDVSEAAQGRLKARLLRATEAVRSKSPPRDPAELRAALRRSRRQKTTIRSLSKENARLHRAVRRSGTRKEVLEGRLAKLRATGKTLSGTVGDLRKALSRSRRQKTTIKSLSEENARLREEVAPLCKATETAEPRDNTIASLLEDNARLQLEVRELKGQARTAISLGKEAEDLRGALRRAHTHNDKLKARHRDEVGRLNEDIARQRAANGGAWQRWNDIIAPLSRRVGHSRPATARRRYGGQQRPGRARDGRH